MVRLEAAAPLAEHFESPREVVGRLEGEVHAVGEFEGIAAEAGFEERDAGERMFCRKAGIFFTGR